MRGSSHFPLSLGLRPAKAINSVAMKAKSTGGISVLALLAGVFLTTATLRAAANVVWERVEASDATEKFEFPTISPPRKNDSARDGMFTVISGTPQPGGGEISKLNDGRVPGDGDEPAENFFFVHGSRGGRLRLDLGRPVEISSINTYSWHPRERGPQVYDLYAAEGTDPNFVADPGQRDGLEKLGWKKLAVVDTRSAKGADGGQYAASIHKASGVGALGSFRYLLFDISRTEDRDPFGNTFFSEIDVISVNAPPPEPAEAEQGAFVNVDIAAAPDLAEWSETALAAVIRDWYPKIVQMLADDPKDLPRKIKFRYRTDLPETMPALTSGNTIELSAQWFRKNPDGVGTVVHEMVHLFQHSRKAERNTPSWLIEGIADYIRWFLFEPEAMGAEITAANFPSARYDSSYRISANFLNWIATIYGREVIWKLNAAGRDGTYSKDLWEDLTGESLEQLGAEWKTINQRRLVRAGLLPGSSKDN